MKVVITELRPEHVDKGYSALLAELANVEAEREDMMACVAVRAMHDTHDLVAIVDNEVVGCVSLHVDQAFHRAERHARITDRIVREEYRGQGIGKQLMQRAMEEAKNAGCVKVGLQSTEKTVPFYQGLGFKPKPWSYDLVAMI